MTYISISGQARHGKDTVAQFLKDYLENHYQRVLVLHYADLLKHICSTYLGWNGEKDEAGRTLLQQVGTDIFRAHDPDYWVKEVTRMVEILYPTQKWDFVILADCRFPNEVLGLHVEVVRPGFDNGLSPEQKTHASETALAETGLTHTDARVTVYNDGDLAQLERTCKDLAYGIVRLFGTTYEAISQ